MMTMSDFLPSGSGRRREPPSNSNCRRKTERARHRSNFSYLLPAAFPSQQSRRAVISQNIAIEPCLAPRVFLNRCGYSSRKDSNQASGSWPSNCRLLPWIRSWVSFHPGGARRATGSKSTACRGTTRSQRKYFNTTQCGDLHFKPPLIWAPTDSQSPTNVCSATESSRPASAATHHVRRIVAFGERRKQRDFSWSST
jgi:hypothetical protein